MMNTLYRNIRFQILMLVSFLSLGCATHQVEQTPILESNRQNVIIFVKDSPGSEIKTAAEVKAAIVSGIAYELDKAGFNAFDRHVLNLDDWSPTPQQRKVLSSRGVNRPAMDFVATVNLSVHKKSLPYVQKLHSRLRSNVMDIDTGRHMANAEVDDSTLNLPPDCGRECAQSKLASNQEVLASHLGALLVGQLTQKHQSSSEPELVKQRSKKVTPSKDYDW